MANYKAIAAVGTAIVNLLADASRDEFKDAKFALFQAADFAGNTATPIPSPEGATVYLYRVSVTGSRRALPPRMDETGQGFKPSIPLDLHFLVTPWAGSAGNQYRLLGWVIRVLEDTPVIPAALLNEIEKNATIFGPGESVELFQESLSLQDLALIWDNIKQVKALPSVTYVARMVMVDSQTPIVSGPAAQTREFQHQKKETS